MRIGLGDIDLFGPWSTIRRAPMVRIVSPFLLGLVIGLKFNPTPFQAGAVVLLITPPVLLTVLLPSTPASRWQRGLLLMIWFFSFGLCWYSVRSPQNDPLHVAGRADHEGAWAMRIEAINGVTAKLVRADASLLAVADRDGLRPVRGTVMLSLMRAQELPLPQVGDRMWVQATMEPIARIADPGGFDRKGWAASRGITWEAFVGADDQHVVDHPWQWTDLFIAARQRINAWLVASGLPKRERALVKALVLGERDELDNEQKNAFARSGTIHVLAVSGMHVGLIFAALSFVTGWWGQRVHARWLRAVLVLLALWSYAGLTGASPSVLRATVMFSLFTLAGLARQNTDHLNSLFAAALVLLLWDPAMMLHLGFLLSFLAVLGIILFYRPLLAWWSPGNWVLRQIWSLAAVSIAAQTLTTPLSLYAFKAFPVWFLPANIVVVTVAGFAVYGSVALLVLFKVPVIGAAIAWLLTQLLRIVGWSTDLFAALPGAYPAVRANFADMLLLYALVLALGAWWLWSWRSMKWLSFAMVAAVLVSLGMNAQRSHTRSAFVVYDERNGFLAGMLCGRELNVLASADSIITSDYTKLKLERHGRAQGLLRTHTAVIGGATDVAATVIGSTILADGRWRSEHFDVLFISGGGPFRVPNGKVLDAVVLADMGYVEEEELQPLADVSSLIVLAGGIPWRTRDRVRTWCEAHQVACHDVREQGAFIREQ